MCFIFSFIDNPTIKQIYIHVHVADKWVHNNLLKFSYFYIQGTAIGQVWIKWGKGGEFRQILNFFFFICFQKVTPAVSKVRHLPPLRYGLTRYLNMCIEVRCYFQAATDMKAGQCLHFALNFPMCSLIIQIGLKYFPCSQCKVELI